MFDLQPRIWCHYSHTYTPLFNMTNLPLLLGQYITFPSPPYIYEPQEAVLFTHLH